MLKKQNTACDEKYWHSHCDHCIKSSCLISLVTDLLRESDSRNESQSNCMVVEGVKPIPVRKIIIANYYIEKLLYMIVIEFSF